MDEMTTRSGAWGNVRYRTVGRGPVLAQRRFNQELARALSNLADAIQARIAGDFSSAYPKLRPVQVRRRITNTGFFVYITVDDPHFNFLEYDTEPHWPPFGKCTLLYQWATARGISPFAVAWGMAPHPPTERVLEYCEPTRGKSEVRMMMHGSGGKESQRSSGRMVATQGKYALTDAVHDTETRLAFYLTGTVEQVIDDFCRAL